MLVSLAESLLECAERCEGVLRSYFATADVSPDTDFKRAMIYAIAAMRAAVAPGFLEGEVRADALRLVVATAGEARELLRAHGFDRELMLCADDCDRAVRLCAGVLASGDGPA
jgi:hypothetical protein